MNTIKIDTVLVRLLVAAQFPQWKDLSIRPVAIDGWDNRTFHLGKHMLVRMPSAEEYAENVEKEQQWLPKLAPLLPLPIPTPLAMGKPAEGYPWNWSIYRWLEGETIASAYLSGHLTDLCNIARSLAQFLSALQRIDSTSGPLPVWRGGSLSMYDAEIRQAIVVLKDKIDVTVASEIWKKALATTWHRSPVWVHGDISAGNLLLKDGNLCAVIDFGGMVVGDPACDLAIAWTLFEGESRALFHSLLSLDTETWARGRAWTLWKALITAAGFTNPNNLESAQC
jgi:aminoglycoside phosphotransferase (APT) family kinase protein